MWQLRGRYPNRGYPKIFNDQTVGVEAKKLFEEAQVMLRDFVANKRVRLNGIVGFYPANAVGDDVEVGGVPAYLRSSASVHVQFILTVHFGLFSALAFAGGVHSSGWCLVC